MVVKCHHRRFFSRAESGAGKHLKAASSRIHDTAESWEQWLTAQPALTCQDLAANFNGLSRSVLPGQRANMHPHTLLNPPRYLQKEESPSQSTTFTNTERLFLRKKLLWLPSSDSSASFALPSLTVNRWDMTFQGNQELSWFNIAAQVRTLLGGKTTVRDSITASVR